MSCEIIVSFDPVNYVECHFHLVRCVDVDNFEFAGSCFCAVIVVDFQDMASSPVHPFTSDVFDKEVADGRELINADIWLVFEFKNFVSELFDCVWFFEMLFNVEFF